jgi:hypothetical protein
MKCPNPECVNGKVIKKVPYSSDIMGEEERDCETCGGTGEIKEDLMPQVIQRLDRIIELLEK